MTDSLHLHAVCVLLSATSLCAGEEPSRVTLPSPQENANFGGQLDTSGLTAIVGSRGAAHLLQLREDGWIYGAALSVPDAAAASLSVSIDGDFCVVGHAGASIAGQESGAVHVFRRDNGTWVHDATLSPPELGPKSMFGYSVAISESVCIVGVPQYPTKHTGAAYVFRRDGTGWHQEAKLAPQDDDAMSRYGESVAASPGYLAVSRIPWNDPVRALRGIHVYRREQNTWVPDATILPVDKQVLFWGTCHPIELDANRLVVGGFNYARRGAVYVFRRAKGGWQEEARLLDPIPHRDLIPGFGAAVSIDGSYIVVGTPLSMGYGSAVVFKFDGTAWEQVGLLAPAAEHSSGFGTSVSITADHCLIGSPRIAVGAADAGAVYGWQEPWPDKLPLIPGVPGQLLLDQISRMSYAEAKAAYASVAHAIQTAPPDTPADHLKRLQWEFARLRDRLKVLNATERPPT